MSNEKLINLEMEMMADMYRRMMDECEQKCMAKNYRDSDLSKAESVCLDRCVDKFVELHEMLGAQLNKTTMKSNENIVPPKK
ncbi:Mitochondrial import inner membrane translocase subunit Tim10 [Intoshia linei]|uniref:Mitochondrial import inner membrane translocase subunit n=1 Tax=Intoshia linei TaxID=1819745 RepID=A0A177ARR3_9BILA|nr:Mitochondrial import inner membrane translocase subunit Tim10 [Intoshia linei]